MKLLEVFRQYLKNQNASPVTIKNYAADIKHFINWLRQKETSATISPVTLLSLKTLKDYKVEMLEQKTPFRTLNRRLSALRKLGACLQSIGYLRQNEALLVKNVSEKPANHRQNNQIILENFKKSLEKEAVNPVTIKNYLSDLRHFLNWLEVAG